MMMREMSDVPAAEFREREIGCALFQPGEKPVAIWPRRASRGRRAVKIAHRECVANVWQAMLKRRSDGEDRIDVVELEVSERLPPPLACHSASA